MTLDEILERGSFSLISHGELNAIRRDKEPYPAWTALSWTPRRESADGDTPRAAVEALLEKLSMK